MVDYATRVLESAVPEVVQAVTANQAGGVVAMVVAELPTFYTGSTRRADRHTWAECARLSLCGWLYGYRRTDT